MIWKPRVGDRVHVKKFSTLPAFDGTITEVLGPTRFNVTDARGDSWFRVLDEIILIEEAAE